MSRDRKHRDIIIASQGFRREFLLFVYRDVQE